MLTLRCRILWNSLRQSPVAGLIGFFLALGLGGLVWSGTGWFLDYLEGTLRSNPVTALLARFQFQVIAERMLGSLLLVLSSAVILSALPNAVAVLFASEDLPLQLALPQPARKVFLFKVGEVFATTALIPTLFLLPILFAYGQHFEAPPVFYFGAVLIAVALFAFPVAVGVALALPLVRYAPAGRAKEWAAAIGAVLGGLLILLLRVLRPEVLLQTNFADPQELDRFLQSFRDVAAPFLPSALAQDALTGLVRGQPGGELGVLVGLSLSLLAVAGVVAGYAYQQGWVRALEGTVRERGMVRPGLLDRLSGRGLAWALWVRDLRLFFRDANQAAQLILVGVLILLYTSSLQFIPLPDDNLLLKERIRGVIGFLHLAFQGFVISGVGVRLAYPLHSLEGLGYWMVQTAPVSRAAVLLTRFGLALFFLLPLGISLGYFSPQMIGLSGGLTQISVLIGVAAAVAAAGLGVGLGTAFPRFDAANPAEVPIGMGGLLYMGLSLLHSAGLVALAARPIYLSFTQPGLNYLASPEGGLWLLLLGAFTALPAGLALLYGYTRMGRSA